jgi:hypothetical protein
MSNELAALAGAGAAALVAALVAVLVQQGWSGFSDTMAAMWRRVGGDRQPQAEQTAEPRGGSTFGAPMHHGSGSINQSHGDITVNHRGDRD